MPDETTETSAETQTTETAGQEQAAQKQTENVAETTQQTQIDSYVNTDGTLKEGWREHLVHDDFKGRPCYNAVGDDVESLLKHIGNQDIAISKQGKGIFVPGENATDTEKDMYYKATGRPDKPEDYTFSIPEGLEQYYADETLLSQAKDAFWKVGMNKETFTAVMALDALRFEEIQKEMKENPIPAYKELWPLVEPILKQEAEDALRAKSGDAYDSRFHYAKSAIIENTVEGEEREAFLAQYGNDPVFADFAATMYLKHHTESNGVDVSLGYGQTSMNIDQRIATIMADPNYSDERTNPSRHKQLVDEIMSLRKQKNPGNIGETST